MSGAASPAGAVAPISSDLGGLMRLAWPVVLARLGVMTMGLTDTIVVGRFSAEQLAFLGLAWAATSPVLGSTMGLLSGVQVMTSRALGEGDRAAAGAALRRGLVYGAWLGVAAAVVLGFGMPAFLKVLRLKGPLAAGAAMPVIVLATSMPSFALSSASAAWLEGLGRMKPPMVLMWIANVLNLAIDLVLVPGRFGLPPMGATGAAIATFLGRTFLTVGTLAYVARMADAGALGVWTRPSRSRAAEAEQRRIGYGAAASNFFEMSAFASMNVIAGWIGPLAVAAWAVTLNVLSLAFMVPLGVGTATAVLVSRAYGAARPGELRRSAALGFAVTAVFGAIIGLVVWPVSGNIAALWGSDRGTIATAGATLALCCVFFLPDGLQVVTAQALRARGDVLVPTLTHLASYVALMLPLAYMLAIPWRMGVPGVAMAVIIAGYVSAGLLLGRFWMLARRD